jgi:hypothetical protein
MRLAGAARLFAHSALWRITGLKVSGRALVRALGFPDEDLRTLAGMFLAQAGRKSEPLLQEALSRRENLPMVLAILGDIGDRKFEPDLIRFSRDGDPAVAKAAQDALRVLDARQQ